MNIRDVECEVSEVEPVSVKVAKPIARRVRSYEDQVELAVVVLVSPGQGTGKRTHKLGTCILS